MLEHLQTLAKWYAAHKRACLATLLAVEGSAPRDPGAAMLIAGDGELCGTLTGGCVEAALVAQALDVLAHERPTIVRYGISDGEAQAVGLSCGGTLEILVDQPEPAFVREVSAHGETSKPCGIAVCLSGPNFGDRLAVFEQESIGSLGDTRLDAAISEELRTQAAREEAEIRLFGEQGEPHGDLRLFLQRFSSKPRMYVFGAVDFAAAMIDAGKFLGYEVILCDARAAFATRARFPAADRIEVAWPDDLLAREPIDGRTAIIAMTHDEKFDIPLLRAALATPAFYVAAMGSRRTNQSRMDALREQGVTSSQLDRLSAPAGLDLGARTPQEIALAIAAELIATRNGRAAGRLKDGTGSIRAHVRVAT